MLIRFVNSKKNQGQITFNYNIQGKGTWCRYDICYRYMLRTPGANPQAAAQAVEEVDVGRSLLLPSLLLCFALWSQFDAFVFF